MKTFMNTTRLLLSVVIVSTLVAGGCARMEKPGDGHRVVLQGSQEVPAVSTTASGSGVITILPDRAVSGSITTSGITATGAHIHEGPAGTNGPVIVPLTKTSDNLWSVPSGAKLTEAQYASHRAGNLYVNVHSAAYPNGEIRGQIRGN